MAYVPIILNKLKYTYNGNDYDLQPVQIAYINNMTGISGVTDLRTWLANNAETANSYDVTGADNSAANRANRDKIVATVNASALNIVPIFNALSVGSDLYFWREDVGRNIRWVWRKNSATAWITGVYAYGTYTWGNTQTVPTVSYGRWATGIQNVGFLYNEDNGRFHWWQNNFRSNDAAHGYNSNPVYFNAHCDYFWAAYSAVLTILCTGNVYNPPTPSTDPYADGGTSTTDPQGTGDFDDSSDAITAPTMTSLSPIDADFIKLYKIDKPNLTAFAQYLFSTSFTTNMEKMWNSVSEAILCLNLLPFTPAGTASTATDIYFDSSDSNADGYLITQQYEELDFGSVTISEFYGSCLDYTPYTQIQLSLPYAQTVNLDPDEFMGRSVGVKCRVDVYTGSALYLIDNGTSVLMQVPATLANPLPWSAKDYSAVISSIANLAITVGGGLAVLATGGASTPAAIAIAGGVAANTASNVMQAKPHYQHGGSAGMGTGMFGIQKPYLIIKRPRQCLPVDNNKYQGYPSMATLLLGNLSGFTKVLQIHLDNLPATDAEKKELETILKGGVWF